MAFVPVSSLAPATVTVAGIVSADVTDRAGRALGVVSGTVTADQGAAGAAWPVSGPLTDAQLRAAAVPVDASGATVPVSGPLTDAQLRAAAVAVDGSAVTQPVSVEALPLPEGAATEDTLAAVNGAVQDVALTAILERDKLPA